MKFPVERQVTAGFVLAVTMLAGLGFVSYRSTQQLAGNAEKVKHAEAVLTHLESLLSAITDAETGQRGYTITGDERFLKPYHEAQAESDEDIRELQRLIVEPTQKPRLAMLLPLCVERLTLARQVVELRRTQGFGAAQQEIATGKGRELQEQIRRIVTEMESVEENILHKREDRTRRTARWTMTFLGVGSLTAIGLLGGALVLVQHGLTERRQLHAELDANRQEQLRLKDEFLAHVSHELRTPLAVIHQFTSILADGVAGATTPDQRRYLAIMVENIAQLQMMINDLLDAVRSQTGKLAVEPEVVTLEPLITGILHGFQHAVAARPLTLRSELVPNLPPVWADAHRLRQILANLIDNGIKFTPPNGSVTIRVVRYAEDPGFLHISVADTGIGVTPEQQAQMFDRLYQVPGAANSSRKGLGLGLHISRELVTLHGGRIWVESQPGQGTTIHFTLPVEPKETQHAPTQDSLGG